MSALDGWIDVFRAGTHRDSAGRERTWSAGDLDAIVSAHERGDPAPVVVGHPQMNAPAWGWIDALRRTGDRLQAKLRDLDPAFREAVEAGRYAGRSVALQDGGDGFRLQHLGFLGGAAPAVSGLAPTRFSGAPTHTYSFAAPGPENWGVIARTLRRLREWIIERDGQDKADGLIPDWETEALREAGESSGAASFAATGTAAETAPEPDDEHGDANEAAAGTDTKTEDEMSGDDKKTAADAAEREKLEAERRELEERETALVAERAAFAAEERRRAAGAELEAHVAAGRVLPAEKDGLASFMAVLPDSEDATITFAAGGAEATETPRAYFASFLARLPKRIDYGETAGGAGPVDANDPAQVAREARTLMAADTTGALTIDRAVRQVAGHQEG